MKKILAVLLAVTLILSGAFFAYALAETAEDAPRAAPMVDLTGVIIAVLALVFDFLLAWIARVIIPPITGWLDENTTEKQKGLIWDAITKMVDAAEQIIIGPGQGARKMAYVQAGLQQRGYTVDTDMIEAAVKRMNDRTKLMIGSTFDLSDLPDDEEGTAEPEKETGCGVKDYCELDENGNPIPEEPQSVNE